MFDIGCYSAGAFPVDFAEFNAVCSRFITALQVAYAQESCGPQEWWSDLADELHSARRLSISEAAETWAFANQRWVLRVTRHRG